MEIGLSYTSKLKIEQAHSALALGSGDMLVLATPTMVALMENAAMMAVQHSLSEGSTTVGTEISVSHVKASPIGAIIEASAELVEIDGRKLVFSVKATQDGELIGEGRHTRFVVDRERFQKRVEGSK